MKPDRRILFVLFLLTTGFFTACKSNKAPTSTPQPQSTNSQPAAGTPAATPQSPAAGSSATGTQGGTQARKPAATSGVQQASAPAPAPRPQPIVLPANTQIRVRLDRDLGSKISQTGDSFTATVSDNVVINGKTVIAKGSRADGLVADAQPLGRFKGGAALTIRLDRVQTPWGSYPIETSSIDRAEKGKGKRTAGFIGGGAGLGALIGGLAGGGKGAAIGAASGAGAGTAGAAFTGNKQIVLPAETPLSFRLEKAVKIEQR